MSKSDTAVAVDDSHTQAEEAVHKPSCSARSPRRSPAACRVPFSGGGVSALLGELTASGVSKDVALRHETALKPSKFPVIAHGGGDDIRRAHELLASAGSSDVQTHPGEA